MSNYLEGVPVRLEHLPHYAARMLRLLQRRDAGKAPVSVLNDELRERAVAIMAERGPLGPLWTAPDVEQRSMEDRLGEWLGQLEMTDSVVIYIADSPDGFYYVRAGMPLPGGARVIYPVTERQPPES